MRLPVAVAFCLLGFCCSSGAQTPEDRTTQDKLRQFDHIVVIYLENRSFNNIFGHFPGANGIANAGPAATQLQANAIPYPTLPQPRRWNGHGTEPDPRFPATLPNGPFLLDLYAPRDAMVPSPIHHFYHEQMQIAGGAMNRFADVSDAGGAVMGYHDMAHSHHWKLAAEFTLADNFFHSAFGGSFLNHAFLVCSCAYRWAAAPQSLVAKLDANGMLLKDGQATPDGYAVNTTQSQQFHHPRRAGDPEKLIPPQTMPHIGDRLDAAGVSWKWYSGGYNEAMAGKPDRNFAFHHMPFAYFANMAPGSVARQARIKDHDDLIRDIAANTLPQVVFYKPRGDVSMHPGLSTIAVSDAHLGEIVARLRASASFEKMLIIVTYDENGGFWDHVAPPGRDRWGPGTRVPMIAIGNMVKRGFIDNTVYETLSINRTIQLRWNVAPVNDIDARATPLLNLLR